MKYCFPGQWAVKCNAQARKMFRIIRIAAAPVEEACDNDIIWACDFSEVTVCCLCSVSLTSWCSLQIRHSHIGLALLLLQIPHLLHMCYKENRSAVKLAQI